MPASDDWMASALRNLQAHHESVLVEVSYIKRDLKDAHEILRAIKAEQDSIKVKIIATLTVLILNLLAFIASNLGKILGYLSGSGH